jgi:hypothetical protein
VAWRNAAIPERRKGKVVVWLEKVSDERYPAEFG